jgi:hypothetical protein
MNTARFFEHWSITENPFKGEEARHDTVFARMAGTATVHATAHPDFEKILGDLSQPAAAIVFGEKGSGKTAIRLQIARRVAAFNAANPAARCLLVPYDDFNPILDRFSGRFQTAKASTDDTLKRLRHLDHIDAVIAMVVPRVVDAVLGTAAPADPLDLGPDPRRVARRLPVPLRRDLLLLQAVYDRAERAAGRTGALRRALRLNLSVSRAAWTFAAAAGWLPAALVCFWALLVNPDLLKEAMTKYTVLALVAIWGVALAKRIGWDRLVRRRLARRMRRQLRVLTRGEASFMASLHHLDDASLLPGVLPTSDADDPRYAAVQRLRRVLGAFGYASLVVVVDRVDEPTLVRGDPERMRAIVWPMLNNKFLQQEGVGIKLLLPIELRHALFKESGAFFQEARLDKQNFVERLNWTGTMLYDLCDARLKACRPENAEPITLLDLFAEDVTRQDLIDALDQMHQPRDAFKMLYQCVTDHCSAASGDAPWRIPRHVLDNVRRQQSDRVQQLYRGIRPA